MSSSVQSISTTVQKRQCLFKIIVIGDISTGKTSLIRRFIHGAVSNNYKPTLGVDFAAKIVQFEDMLIHLQFWDISGQERFANMTRVYYRDSHGAIVVYDCKRSETLAGAFRWKKVSELFGKRYSGREQDLDSKLVLDNGQPIPAILVANKCDLDNSLDEQQVADCAQQGGFRAGFKLSAKTGDGIESAIDFLLKSIVCAEREGLYLMPMLQRDNQLRRLSVVDNSYNYAAQKKRGRGRKFFKNTCC